MEPHSFLYSRFASELALTLSQTLPGRVGYPLAELIGRIVSRTQGKDQAVAVRANQWVLSKMRATASQLDQACSAVFRFAGYVLYDFYHHLNRPEAILQRVDLSPRLQQLLKRCQEGRSGTFFVLPHMGNFDLAGRALALRGLKFQVLSYPQPPSGYRMQNRIRAADGIDVTPISISSMRQAVERLRAGGTVMTGLDRPISDSNYRPKFFGRPAILPVSHIRLAMKAGVPITVVAAIRQLSGKYLIDASETIPMQSYPDLKEEMETNAEAVLHCAERFIMRDPHQWLMFYPVWPETIRDMP